MVRLKLTDAELRAAPIPICGTVTVANPGGGEGGGLTDAELRANPVPVSGSFYPATQPVSGTFWQATQPVSIASMPSTPVTGTFWQATQPVSIAATVAVQRLNDTARTIVNAATAIAGVQTVTSEALLSLNVSRNGAATSPGTSISVTSGKRLRIIGVTAGVISTSAAVISCRVALRMNPSGAVTTTSPILAILPMSQQAAALAQAGNECALMFSEAIEVSGTMQVGLSQVASATTGTVWASLIAYEY